jgi:hypothetical protein
MKYIFWPIDLHLAEADRQTTEIQLEGFLTFIENLLELERKSYPQILCNCAEHFIRI